MCRLSCKSAAKTCEPHGISVCMWNINGILTGKSKCDKLKDSNFLRTVQGQDIIALIETHVSPQTPLELDGYWTLRVDRPQSKNTRHFGGLAVFIKNELKKSNVKIVQKTLDYIWLKFDKTNIRMDEDIFMCIAYVPPSNSEYLAKIGIDVLEQIQNDIMKYSRIGQIVLTGDFNARTGTNLDFIENDDDIGSLSTNYIIDQEILQRKSFDTIVNTRGKEFLELCISSRIRILNGRTIGDTLGYNTCHKWNGSSVVDYTAVSETLISSDRIYYFKVHQTLGDLSDHCCISFKIKTPALTATEQSEVRINPFPIKYKWHKNAISQFQASMASDEIQVKLKHFIEKENCLSEHDMNQAAMEISDIYSLAAEKSLKIIDVQKKKPIKKSKNKEWYDKSLSQLKRQLYKCGKKLVNDPKNGDHRRNYFMLLKLYRKQCKTKYRQYRQQIINDLDQMHEKSPKAYWELVKKLKEEKNTNTSKISPSEWYSHFSKLADKNNFKHPSVINNEDYMNIETAPSFSELDFKIRENEISKSINKLKNNKACGPDGLCNEVLKYSQHIMLPVLAKLFNNVLLSGTYPNCWAEGHIKKIFKKGDLLDTNNYRGITITNVIGKLFNSILNNRIISFLDKYKKSNKEQISFKDGHRTSDHIFIIKTLIRKYKQDHKSIYACFIDFKKAFDSVSIPCLLYKLKQIGVTGHIYTLISDMYNKITLRVDVGNGLTDAFTSNIGVRQGDNLSPTLFNIFINDIPEIFHQNECNPVYMLNTPINCLLYADDLVVLSESEKGLQNSLNVLHKYCDKWGLTVNTSKTHTIIFNPKKKEQTCFFLDGIKLDPVKEIQYLGVILSQNGSFESTKSTLYKKGLKSLFKLKSIISPLPKISTCMHLFNHLVKPVLLYSSEVWSYSIFGEKNHINISTDNFEKLYNTRTSPIENALIKYNKMLLHLQTRSSNLAPYGELGVYPLYIDCIIRTLKYWSFIETKSTNTLLKEALDCDKYLHHNGIHTWYSYVVNIQKLSGINHNANYAPTPSDIMLIRNKLKTRYSDHWMESLDNKPTTLKNNKKKLRTYKLFKTQFNEEKYLNTIKNKDWKICLTKFRVSAHNLLIETGRHHNIKAEDRICKHCNLNEIEDEKHFLIECPLYTLLRQKLMQEVNKTYANINLLNALEQFCWIMSCETNEIMYSLAEYIFKAMELRKSHS